ncbi:MAG TPA: hypothetical protein VGZ90_05795 [Puia sp.]|jgi:hypothetical protein|nr:hypothetical protein [Puia sp.]
MKIIFLLFLVLSGTLVISCTKNSIVPAYTPPVSSNFTVTSMNHTKDTVNLGDTIYLNVVGTMYDTLNVYAYVTAKSSATGSPVYSYGSSSSPVKLTCILSSANVSDMNPWTSTIKLTGLTSIPNSKLTISANFIYQLSLSSEGGGLASATDGGIINKTVFIQ